MESQAQQINFNETFLPVLTTSHRYYLLMGGRARGASYFCSQYIKERVKGKQYFRGAVMRFILGDIRNSIFQEILDRIEEDGDAVRFNIKEGTLEVESGFNSVKGIGFRKSSGDQKAKLKSLAQFTDIYIEEADEIAEEDFMQLDDSLRTIKSNIRIFLIFNTPPKNHWLIKRWFNLLPSGVDGFFKAELKNEYKDNTCFIFSTYKDNEINLNRTTLDNYERYKITRPEYYYSMIQGLVSEGAKGLIFPNWKVISDEEYNKLEYEPYYGQDFGFTNDPTALIEIKEHNNKIYLKELIYETGLTNKRIAERYSELGISRSAPIYADSAEPKSIEEIRLEDWNILPAIKGKDSVKAGIDYLQDKEVYYTESSKNLAIEKQEYKWSLDKNKEPTNTPVDKFNHGMDGTRYGTYSNNKQDWSGIV
ncbi:MAG: phage terminase large subunit [Patescibacteria group bacterium]